MKPSWAACLRTAANTAHDGIITIKKKLYSDEKDI